MVKLCLWNGKKGPVRLQSKSKEFKQPSKHLQLAPSQKDHHLLEGSTYCWFIIITYWVLTVCWGSRIWSKTRHILCTCSFPFTYTLRTSMILSRISRLHVVYTDVRRTFMVSMNLNSPASHSMWSSLCFSSLPLIHFSPPTYYQVPYLGLQAWMIVKSWLLLVKKVESASCRLNVV